MSDYHKSVLLKEAIESLHVQPGEKYIDATLGGGGHTCEILQAGGIVLGIDVDQNAIDQVLSSKYLVSSIEKKQLFLARGNFRDIRQIAKENRFEKVAGIIFDLGVSSYQFDTQDRGFSFQKDAPLDMRMGKQVSVTAADLINALTKEELAELFTKYGEEPFAKRIAHAISEARRIKKIETTFALAEIIIRAYPKHHGNRIHPATKVFQALRIAVNDELNSLEEGLQQAIELLDTKGRLVVISFHSLEDRIVKTSFIDFANQKKGDIVTKKPVTPTYEEIKENTRSRSAKLRTFEKI